MARAFAELEANPTSTALSHAEWLGLLLDREITERDERRLRARLRYARLRHQAAVEDIDYRAARGLDRALFQKLIIGDWINAHDNLVITGPTGVGKSWLACALGHESMQNRGVITPLFLLPCGHHSRAGSPDSVDGKRPRVCRSARPCARRGRAARSLCSSASAVPCSCAWPRSH